MHEFAADRRAPRVERLAVTGFPRLDGRCGVLDADECHPAGAKAQDMVGDAIPRAAVVDADKVVDTSSRIRNDGSIPQRWSRRLPVLVLRRFSGAARSHPGRARGHDSPRSSSARSSSTTRDPAKGNRSGACPPATARSRPSRSWRRGSAPLRTEPSTSATEARMCTSCFTSTIEMAARSCGWRTGSSCTRRRCSWRTCWCSPPPPGRPRARSGAVLRPSAFHLITSATA